MLNIAICDDEKKILEDMSQKVREILGEVTISLYKEGTELINDIKVEAYDLILLDIDMPGISGLDTAGNIRQTSVKPLIVFVTSHDELVYESLQLHPFGFVRKSYMNKELGKVLKDAAEEISCREKPFIFHNASGDIRLKLKDILYFEAEGNYIRIITKTEEFRFRETMQELERSLSDHGFVRTHKGFLVNQDYIKIIRSDKIILNNDTEVPFGRKYSDSGKRKLMRGMTG